MTSRNWTLRVLSPLLIGGLGLLTTTGCPLPKQLGDEEGDCDDGGSMEDEGDTCGPNDPDCEPSGGECDPSDPMCSDGQCDPMLPGDIDCQPNCDPNTPNCSETLCTLLTERKSLAGNAK